jgi:transposase
MTLDARASHSVAKGWPREGTERCPRLKSQNLDVGLEAGPLSQWLYSALAEAGLPVICVETRHMRAVLKAQINKTDRTMPAASPR